MNLTLCYFQAITCLEVILSIYCILVLCCVFLEGKHQIEGSDQEADGFDEEVEVISSDVFIQEKRDRSE